MRFTFTDEQTAMGDLVRQALAECCPPGRVRAASVETPTQLWPELAALGIVAVELPEDLGGLGLGPCEWILPLEAAGYHGLPLPLAETLALLPALVSSGRTDLAQAVGEGRAQVALLPAGGFAQGADDAEAIFEVDGPRLYERVDLSTPQRQPSVDPTRRLFSVDGRRVPVSADGHAVFDRAALATAAQLLGLSRRMLDMAVAYAKARRQFGKPIGAFQAVQHHLADALLAVEFAAPLVYRAAWALSQDDPDAVVDISAAKAAASDAARTARKKALQVHGAIGFAHECDLQLYLLRAIALEAAWGDAAWHRARVGDCIL